MANPKITIKNFAGMGQGGSYYLDGMRPHKLGNESILTTGHKTQNFITEASTNASSVELIDAITAYSTSASATDSFALCMSSNEIYLLGATSATNSKGLIHTISASGSGTDQIIATTNPDIYVTKDNTILYSSGNHLGTGRRYTATSGSTTTFVVSGEDFSAQTVPPVAGDKIYNITKGEEYTIAAGGVGTTTLTVDTGTEVEADDVFIVFDDDAFKLDTATSYGYQFDGQVVSSSWVRQIKLLEDSYYILNGNYLASLDVSTEYVIASQTKQLPNQHQASCFDVRGSNNMLVGADYKGGGRLLLWDGYSEGWLSTIETAETPTAIKSYKNGWVVTINNILYFTNGYELQELSEFPDLASSADSASVDYNGIEVIGETIYLAASPELSSSPKYNRAKIGLWSYKPKDGWGYSPLRTTSAAFYSGTARAVKKIKFQSNRPILFVSGYDQYATNNYVLNKFNEDDNDGTKCSALLYVKLPYKMRISKIELNLAPKYDSMLVQSESSSITVGYGDGNSNIWEFAQAGAGCTTTSVVTSTGATYPAEVGRKVLVLTGDAGGDISWITAIANAGEANETWTVSPALSAAPESSTKINFIDIKKSETKTLTPLDITKSLDFTVSDFYSDKLFIDIMFDSTNVNIDLHSINIY